MPLFTGRGVTSHVPTSITACLQRNCAKNGGGGIRTPLNDFDTLLQNNDKTVTEIAQDIANTNTYEILQAGDFEQKLTLPEHSSDTILHKKCVISVSKNLHSDLKELINKWPDLPKNIREAIKLIVE